MDLMTVKLALVVIGVLGVAIWQLYDVNRELRKHDEADTSESARGTGSNIDGKRLAAAQRPSDNGSE